MSRFGTYFVRFSTVRRDLTGLPSWARAVFMVLALPGIVLVGLSILTVIVSVVVLLLYAIPVYTILRTITRGRNSQVSVVTTQDAWPNERKHVDVKIRTPDVNVPDEVNGE